MDTTARAQDSSPLSISTIGEDLTITGNVTSKGELHLNGQIQGDVQCVSLVLGENAQLKGGVVAEDVLVRGRLIGSVRALRVMLQSTSHVEGNLVHKSLAVEHGTHFEGESRPSEDPLTFSPEAPAVELQPNHNGHPLTFSPEVPAVELQPNHNGHPEAVTQRERGNGFIRSLPESHSA